MRPASFTNTPAEAAAYEMARAADEWDDPRPTKAEADRDEWGWDE